MLRIAARMNLECSSGLCQWTCEHALDKNAVCTKDSACGHTGCNLHALCIEVGRDAETSKRIMPIWVAFIVIVGSIRALLAFLCAMRRESSNEYGCDSQVPRATPRTHSACELTSYSLKRKHRDLQDLWKDIPMSKTQL